MQNANWMKSPLSLLNSLFTRSLRRGLYTSFRYLLIFCLVTEFVLPVNHLAYAGPGDKDNQEQGPGDEDKKDADGQPPLDAEGTSLGGIAPGVERMLRGEADADWWKYGPPSDLSSPNRPSNPATARKYPSKALRDESNAMREAQAQRNALIGLPEAQAFNDIYFTSADAQWGEVAVYTPTKKDVNHDEGVVELEETDSNGKLVRNRYEVKVTRYEPGKLNDAFNDYPKSFELDSDIQTEVKNGIFVVSHEEVSGKKKKVFRRCFRIPGIQSVVVNSAFIQVLLLNGEFKTILGAHNRLFQFNELAGGGPLLVATTSVITNKQLLLPDGRLKPEVAVQNHDARRGAGIYGKNFNVQTIRGIRYGDVEVTAPENGETKVVDLFPLGGIAEVAAAHLALLKVREDILSGEKPFAAVLDGAQQATTLARKQPELLPQANSLNGLMALVSQPTLSATFRRTAQPWEENPWELPEYRSTNLGQLQAFVAALKRKAADPGSRATYPGAHEEKTPSPGTREADLKTDEERLLADAKQVALKSTDLGWAGRFFRDYQNAALILASLAAVQAVIYFMPNSPMWVETKLFHLDTAIPAIDLPLGEWGRIATSEIPLKLDGPAVPYILKFWMGAGAIAVGAFLALPVSFAYLSDRILGRPLPRGFGVGLKQTLDSGWEVFTTFGLRLGSYLLISWRDTVVQLVSGIPKAIRSIPLVGWLLGSLVRADGLPSVMQAMRYGQNPVSYLTHKENAGSTSIFSRTWTALKKLWSGEGSDPAEFQGSQEATEMMAYRIALFGLMASLAKNKLVDSDGPVDSLLLRRTLGEEKFNLLEQRFRLAAGRVKKTLYAMKDVQEKPFKEVLQQVDDECKFLSLLSDPLLALTDEETKELGSSKMEKTISRIWPMAAGSNDIFFRFRNAEASRSNVLVWSQNFQNDIGTHPIWMGATPGDDAFASSANPGNLLFGDQSNATAGMMGTRGLVEVVFNVFAWIANIPTDELTYGQAVAVSVPNDFHNPVRVVDGNNPVFRTIRDANPASLGQSMASYATWLLPWNGDFYQMFERLSTRITKDQLRTWKNFLISGTVLTFAGLLMEWDTLKPEQQVMGVAFLAATFKTLLFNTYAYVAYRNWWMGHSIGIRNNTIEPEEDTKTATNLVLDARDALLESDAGDSSRLEAAYKKLEAWYERFNKQLPKEITSIADPKQRLERASVFAVAQPPMVTTVHPFAGTATNQAITVITTVIGTFGSALAWKYAFDTDWFTVGAVVGGLYGVAKVVGWAAGNARAALTYNWGVSELREAIEAAQTEATPANSERLFAAVLAMVKVYQRYDKDGVFDNHGIELLRKNGELVEVAKRVYKTAVESAPADNWATQRAGAYEKETTLCAEVLANSASNEGK